MEQLSVDINGIKKLIKKKNKAVGYYILDLPGCPYSLPRARSMTQARNDYYHLLPLLVEWYQTQNSQP